MAFIRCGGGGALTETTLWTNSDSTSSFTYQDVTISDDINNYDYIKIIYYPYVSSSSGIVERIVIMTVDDFVNTGYKNYKPFMGLCAYNGAMYCRGTYYVSDTSIHFSSAVKVSTSGTSNATCVPVSIIGLK